MNIRTPKKATRRSLASAILLAAGASTLLWSCQLVSHPTIQRPECRELGAGVASFYGHNDGFSGRKTANGETFDPTKLTAAHRTLPFDSIVTVRLKHSNRSVRVRINDRGPMLRSRVIDLSYAAARKLGITESGTAEVRILHCST